MRSIKVDRLVNLQERRLVRTASTRQVQRLSHRSVCFDSSLVFEKLIKGGYSLIEWTSCAYSSSCETFVERRGRRDALVWPEQTLAAQKFQIIHRNIQSYHNFGFNVSLTISITSRNVSRSSSDNPMSSYSLGRPMFFNATPTTTGVL